MGPVVTEFTVFCRCDWGSNRALERRGYTAPARDRYSELSEKITRSAYPESALCYGKDSEGVSRA